MTNSEQHQKDLSAKLHSQFPNLLQLQRETVNIEHKTGMAEIYAPANSQNIYVIRSEQFSTLILK